ncbi:MAG TPA: FtsK/SpoIIIE domain-containing protein, partial [Microthrixaceae bacterium]|nr:FtsK/SpoIIIE domain-containing protein [Microthrixaceae bacterium]
SLLPPDSTRLLWLSPTRAGIPKRLRQVFELGDSPVLHLVADHLNPRASDGVDQAGTPYIGTEQIPVEPRNVEDLTDDQVVPLARSLAPLVPRRSPLDRVSTDPASGGGARLGDILAERDMLTSADSVRRQWKASRSHSGLDAPVGRAGHGVLHLDLKVDGPHALVAGTTGSGKSEFLRSLVASMALHHGPDRLTFLLVDYKGGAAFNSLDRLPHSVGMITDLGPDLAERALISLRAEVLRREKVLASLGLVDLNEAFSEEPGAADGPTLQVPPSLVVVVDEFATLARELPDFVDGLVDIAQRGRSLGIHLILATQRPAGVVTDSIRANTSLRIALRVADPDDSTDVVDSPDAAQLPRTSPGQALVKIGSNPPVHVQFAYSAESSRRPPRVLTRPLGPGPIASQIAGLEATSCAELPAGGAKNDSTELSLAIAVANSAAVAAEIAQPIRPWVPPLPESLGLESIDKYVTHLSDLGSSPQDSLVVGIADRPSRQRIDPLTVDLSACGGALILGAGGSGKSTTLATIAQAGSQCGTTHTYLIGSRQGVFADPLSSDLQPAVLSDVIELSDAERTLRLLHSAVGLILDQRRTGEPRSAGLLILLDDYSAFEQFHERINRGEALDLLTRIAREGRSAGVHIAVTAQRRIEVPPTLASNLGLQIFLRCTSEDEASVLGLSPNAASSDLPAGRGYVNGDLVQIALPTLRSCVAGTTGAGSTGAGSTGSGSTGADSTGDRAPDSTNAPVMDSHRSLTGPLIRSLPEQLHLSDLALLGDDRCPDNKIGHASIATPQSVWSSLLVGLNGDDLSVAELDLEHSHLVVAGPRRSGRSTTLALLASALELASSKHSQSRQPSERRRSAAFGLSPRPGPQTAHWTESFNTSTRPTPLAHGWDSDNGTREVDAFFQTVSATALGGTPTLLAVDDLPDLLEGPFELAIESGLAALMTVAEQAPLRLVLSGEIEAMTRSFSGTLTRVRAGRTAILIQPDPDVHGSIAHCDIPRRDELRSVPGRGWLICDSKTLPVQLAQP